MEEVVGGELATEIVHLKKVAFLIPTRLKLYLDSLSGTRFAGTTSPCFLQLPQKTSSLLTNQGLWYMDRLIKGTKNLGDVKKQGKDMKTKVRELVCLGWKIRLTQGFLLVPIQ